MGDIGMAMPAVVAVVALSPVTDLTADPMLSNPESKHSSLSI
jgi:hypothetical protein